MIVEPPLAALRWRNDFLHGLTLLWRKLWCTFLWASIHAQPFSQADIWTLTGPIQHLDSFAAEIHRSQPAIQSRNDKPFSTRLDGCCEVFVPICCIRFLPNCVLLCVMDKHLQRTSFQKSYSLFKTSLSCAAMFFYLRECFSFQTNQTPSDFFQLCCHEL